MATVNFGKLYRSFDTGRLSRVAFLASRASEGVRLASGSFGNLSDGREAVRMAPRSVQWTSKNLGARRLFSGFWDLEAPSTLWFLVGTGRARWAARAGVGALVHSERMAAVNFSQLYPQLGEEHRTNRFREFHELYRCTSRPIAGRAA